MGLYTQVMLEPVATSTPGFAAGIPQNGLVALWDAGSTTSHPGTGTTWTNIVGTPADGSAASAYNLTTSGLTFNGTAGRRSSAEGLDTAGSGYGVVSTNTSFLDSLHKVNATVTTAGIFKLASVSTRQGIFCTGPNGSFANGFEFMVEPTGNLRIVVSNGTSAALAVTSSGLYVPTNQPVFLGLSYNETTGAGTFYANGAISSFTTRYTSPSSTAATTTRLLGFTDGTLFTTGSRAFQSSLYNRALSQSELDQAFDAIRGRFPGL